MENKVAAVWARVSTPGQADISLDSQVEMSLKHLRSFGYQVPSQFIFRVDWTSMDLQPCPKFQELQNLVKAKQINAIGMLDRDRLEALPLQRLLFLAACEMSEVKPIVCQGPPFIEGDAGQLVEFVLAMGKHASVKRASQGSKNGLFDKLRLKRQPSFLHKVRGYAWDGSHRLVPNSDWSQVQYACEQALAGVPIRQIRLGLKKQGVDISIPGLYRWLTNPIYGGRYYGHRRERVEPAQRKGSTYGKSSGHSLPFEEWYHLPEVEVLNPPLTWEQYLQVQERLTINKQMSRRNAKKPYILRSRVFCDTHNRRMCGRMKMDGVHFHYGCPVSGCARPYINGLWLEADVKSYCRQVLTSPKIVGAELEKYRKGKGPVEGDLRRELRELGKRESRSLTEETELERLNLRNTYDPEVYQRLKSSYRAERQWCSERREIISSQLAALGQREAALASLTQIQARLGSMLDTDDESFWLDVFVALNLEVHVRENGRVEIEAEIPPLKQPSDIVLTTPQRC